MNHRRLLAALLVGIAARCNALRGLEAEETTLAAGFVPECCQEIRGGDDVINAIPWYVVFADNVLCGGVLVGFAIVSWTAMHFKTC